MPRPTFVALDFELANPHHASICSVGMVEVVEGRVVNRWYQPVRPTGNFAYLAPFNMKIAHLDYYEINRAPSFRQVAPWIHKTIAGRVVVGHNIARADLSMFKQSWFGAGLPGPSPTFRFVCTETLGRERLPGLTDYRLPTVYAAATGKVMSGHHKPDVDALASAEIACALVDDHAHLEDRARLKEGVTLHHNKPLLVKPGFMPFSAASV